MTLGAVLKTLCNAVSTVELPSGDRVFVTFKGGERSPDGELVGLRASVEHDRLTAVLKLRGAHPHQIEFCRQFMRSDFLKGFREILAEDDGELMMAAESFDRGDAFGPGMKGAIEEGAHRLLDAAHAFLDSGVTDARELVRELMGFLDE